MVLSLAAVATFVVGAVAAEMWTFARMLRVDTAQRSRSSAPTSPGVAPTLAPLPVPAPVETAVPETVAPEMAAARDPGPPPARRAPARKAPRVTEALPRGSLAPPRHVEVLIISRPEGATVRIRGVVWGVTPLSALLPATEGVSIDLALADHAPARVTWSPRSKVTRVRATLVPEVPRSGSSSP